MESKQELNVHLDDDFLFMLELASPYFNQFENDKIQSDLCQAWLDKLCCTFYESVECKRKRNSVLCKLLSCMQSSKLTEPFLKMPDNTKILPNIHFPPISESTEWLDDMLEENSEARLFRKGGDDCRTYLASKMLDNNRGACAYIGISAVKGGDTEWAQIGTGKFLGQKINGIESFSYDSKYKYYRYIVDLCNDEIHGRTAPGTNCDLENLIQQLIEEKSTTEDGKLLHGEGKEARSMALYFLKTKYLKLYNEKASSPKKKK